MIRQKIRAVAAVSVGIALVLALAGCGYTTRSSKSLKFKTIAIIPFANKIDITLDTDVANKYKIYKPMLETDVTRAITNKYLIDGNLRPVKEEFADVVLRGEVLEFRKDPLRYDENDEVEEYRVNIVVNMSLWDRKENKLVWEEKGFTGDTTFFTTGSASKPETTAINDAITDLARRIVERTVEEW